MQLVEVTRYEILDDNGKAIASFSSKDDAVQFLSWQMPKNENQEFVDWLLDAEATSTEPSKPVKQSPEEELIESLKDIGMKVSAPKTVEGVGRYWVLTQHGLKAHLWHCGARGWSICHPTQHEESKRSQAWLDIFAFDVVEFADCNGIELEA
jgi:hypothetical protein